MIFQRAAAVFCVLSATAMSSFSAALAAPTTQPAPPPTASPAANASGEPVPIDFVFLSRYRYRQTLDGWLTTGDGKAATQPATTQPLDEIPARIRALNGRRIAVTGFMIPLQFEDGQTQEFLLVPSMQHCMYCVVPQLNKMIVVSMKVKKGVSYRAASPIVVAGRIEIGEKYEGGVVTSLYRMEGERVSDVEPGSKSSQP